MIRDSSIVASFLHVSLLLDSADGEGTSDGGVNEMGARKYFGHGKTDWHDQQGFQVRGLPTAVFLVASVGKARHTVDVFVVSE